MLSHEEDFYVGGEAGDGVEVLERVTSEDWDLVILDLTMPRKNGFEVLKEIRKARPDLPVLIVSVHPAEQYAEPTLAMGARGYIMKDLAPEELVPQVRRVLQETGE